MSGFAKWHLQCYWWRIWITGYIQQTLGVEGSRGKMKRQENKGKTLKKRNWFCSGSSGNKKGWLDAGITLFSLLCCQVVDKQLKQTISIEQRIRQTLKEEYNQSRRESTDEALDEQISVIPDTDY